MTALDAIEHGLRRLGYSPTMLIRNYSFADVLSTAGTERRVDLAAFTQVPESYRSAAFGVISGAVDEGAVSRHRALGAPILFSVGTDDIGVWRVSADAAPRLLERVPLTALPELFARNSDRWRPQAVHRAKSLGHTQTGYQLDFVDLGLVPAIEHEVEEKLDRLLKEVIGRLLQDGEADHEDAAFRTTFRLLAAKILLDREHPAASLWANATVEDVLRGIESYYNLDRMQGQVGQNLPNSAVTEAWALLRNAISFRNISSDSLAFVYENTLVTADTRKRFGTHSTPRQLAEFVVEKVNLARFDLSQLTLFEPFTGAGTFLVAALRHMGDILPEAMSGEDRHAFLVQRIRGAELDSFACEVATLSLVLADFPNANGWKITTDDLFRPGVLSHRLTDVRVVLCNPPWEDFNAEERLQYPEMAAQSISKPMAVLEAVLDASPEAIGFVLPQGFLRQKKFAELRQRVAETYGRVEVTSIPDRIFQRAGFAAAVLVASEPRTTDFAQPTELVSTVVEDRDRAAFLSRGKVTAERRRSKFVTSGDLWIGQLDELWEHLEHHPRLGDIASVHRGLQWFNQDAGFSKLAREGFKLGVLRPADSLQQYGITATGFLDVSSGAAYRKGPLKRPWELPKVLANVARISRGPWCLAGALDNSGLVPSQAFFGIWPEGSSVPGEAIEAIINCPLASAFASEQASIQHLTNDLLRRMPIPRLERLHELVDAVKRYRAALSAAQERVLHQIESEWLLNRLLMEVDAAALKAYDLPPKLERRLLEYFRGYDGQRRTSHVFDGWIPEEFTAYIPLHEYLGPLVQSNRGAWALDVFKPAPPDEVVALRRFVH